MEVREQVPLAELTTFKVGGSARFVVRCRSEEELQEALAFAREQKLPYVILGEGSNVLPNDEDYAGLVIRMGIEGCSFDEEGDTTVVVSGAGVPWDTLVTNVATRGLWGMENLAGIPGTVGAAPVQNIGAYGMEQRQTFLYAEVLDSRTGKLERITEAEAAFGYRDSRFKHEPNLIIVRVAFRLSRRGAPQTGYADLQKAEAEGTDLSTPSAIGNAVRAIRAKKFPDLCEYGTAGSFFKNPLLTKEAFTALAQKYGAVPSFPAGVFVKVPLAFILDRVLGLRGYRKGATFLFGNQPLVLVAERGARASEVEALAREIELRVFEATGIHIEREVRALFEHECVM